MFVYIIYSLVDNHIEDCFADEDECISFYNKFYKSLQIYDWRAINVERYFK